MKAEFAVRYFSSNVHEVNVFLPEFDDALLTARFLSSVSDIRFAAVYQVDPESREDVSRHMILCQFQHGAISQQYPSAEMLIEKAGRFVKLSPFRASGYH